MTPTEGEPADPAGPGTPDPFPILQAIVAIVLMVLFVGMLVVLATLRADAHWDRLVFLLGGLEAIVFAAAGAFFGTTAQRGAVTAARQDAAAAREQAATERSRAEANLATATAGEVLATTVLARAAAAPQPPAGTDGPSGPRRAARDSGTQVPSAESSLDELATLARMLFPTVRPPTP